MENRKQPLPEAFLQLAWQSLRFRTQSLLTTDGRPVLLLHPGKRNPNAGPDFLQAHLLLAGEELKGPVEIHRTTADWHRHAHSEDERYNEVILHVVQWSDSPPPRLADGRTLPELEIGPHLNTDWVERFEDWTQTERELPCAETAAAVSDLHRRQWISRCGTDRLTLHAEETIGELNDRLTDWPQVFWERWVASFVGKVNKDAGRLLAQLLPLKLLQRYAENHLQVEALLMGAAGWLDTDPPPDEHCALLCTEWRHLKNKHRLEALPETTFQFLRMRPAGFPSIRLAQLAGLLHRFPTIQQLLTDPDSLKDRLTDARPSDYWQTRYRLGASPGKPTDKLPGKQLWYSILINAILPTALAYYKQTGREEEAENTLARLDELPPEENNLADLFVQNGWRVRSALETQGLIHLHRNYCAPRRCAECAIGRQILKQIPPRDFLNS